MSIADYNFSKYIDQIDPPFYGIIMAAMRKADTDNEQKLRAAFPQVWEELAARYNAPGGFLEGEAEELARALADA